MLFLEEKRGKHSCLRIHRTIICVKFKKINSGRQNLWTGLLLNTTVNDREEQGYNN